jgi:hypothetical protein
MSLRSREGAFATGVKTTWVFSTPAGCWSIRSGLRTTVRWGNELLGLQGSMDSFWQCEDVTFQTHSGKRILRISESFKGLRHVKSSFVPTTGKKFSKSLLAG